MNTSGQPKRHRQTAQIRLLLQKQSDQVLTDFYSEKHFVNVVLVSNILFENRKIGVPNFRTLKFDLYLYSHPSI